MNHQKDHKDQLAQDLAIWGRAVHGTHMGWTVLRTYVTQPRKRWPQGKVRQCSPRPESSDWARSAPVNKRMDQVTSTHTLLLSISTLALAAATGLMWMLMPQQSGFSPADLHIGQDRATAEAVFAGQGIFGRTCYGELAIYADRNEAGHEQHVMAFLNEGSKQVEALEVQQVETPVSSAAQCEALVTQAAVKIASSAPWSEAKPSKHSAGATQRSFLRHRGADGHMREIWGDHKGAHGFQTCDLYWRISIPGREQLSADGEWHIPGDRSVPFDPLKVAEIKPDTKKGRAAKTARP